MRAGFAIVIFCLGLLSAAADEVPRVHRLELHVAEGVTLDGVAYREHEAFLAAVARLAPGSRLTLTTGCTIPYVLPLTTGPGLSLDELTAYCRAEGIRFILHSGLHETLLRRTFPASQKQFTSSAAARQWLESQGVQFGPSARVRWNPATRELLVRNTEEQLDLVEVVVKPEAASTP